MGKFQELKDGEIFKLRGESFKKLTALTYKSIENPILGEYYIDPMADALINAPAPVIPGTDVSAKIIKEEPLKVEQAPTLPVKKSKKGSK